MVLEIMQVYGLLYAILIEREKDTRRGHERWDMREGHEGRA